MTQGTLTSYKNSVSQDRDAYLGYIVMYSVHDERTKSGGLVVAQADVKLHLANVGLDAKPPKVPHANDLFRRITTQAKITRQPTGVEGEFRNFKFVDISDADHEIVRRLVCETIDSKGKRLRYQQLVDVVFNKDTKEITRKDCDDYGKEMDLDSVALGIVADIRTKFVSEDDMLTAYAVRQFIRDLLGSVGATSVRTSGGAYFVTAAHEAKLDKIEAFVNCLPRTFADMHTIPLVDNDKQRQMVKEALENEVENAVDDLTMKIREYRVAGKPMRQGTFDRLSAEVSEMVQKAQEYEAMLETKMNETHSRLAFLNAGILRLSGNLSNGGD